jgi:hypothetical protein
LPLEGRVIEVTSSVLTPFAFYRIIRTSPPLLGC